MGKFCILLFPVLYFPMSLNKHFFQLKKNEVLEIEISICTDYSS